MMSHIGASARPALPLIEAAVARAVLAVPPAWPLASSVAVNPFLGQAGDTLAEAGARLARVAGARVTMPRRWYRERIASGAILDADLAAALADGASRGADQGAGDASAVAWPDGVAALKAAVEADEPETDQPEKGALPSVADLAAVVSGVDWPGLVAERFGAWAAGYCDEGQALWAAPRGRGAYAAWRAVGMHDLTPEIAGLKGFAAHVAEAPEDALAAIARAVERLGMPVAALETYFHQMLMTLGGWAQYARYRQWQAELDGGTDETIIDFLAIRLLWEEALFGQYAVQIADGWAAARAGHAAPVVPTPALVVDAILQSAGERAAQRGLAARLGGRAGADVVGDHGVRAHAVARPALQAVFCIDVRSEVFRRALESLDGRIRTLGFAGFFGMGVAHRRFASDVTERRLPALLKPGPRSCSAVSDGAAEQRVRVRARARRAWGRFKLAAVSSFAFVEASGLVYAGKLVADALGRHGAGVAAEPAPVLDPGVDLAARVGMAAAVLRGMSLTDGFARLVLVVGHGAGVVNNPHASGLHCGACGGYSGEVNARLLASLLNEHGVRAGLVAEGIVVPADTLFVAALHDTTADQVTLYAADSGSAEHVADIARARAWLGAAGALARGERALRLPRAVDARSVLRRGRDWSETRPEWGLTGCQAFIAAPRGRTAGRDLAGRAFLHDYDWRRDEGFAVLEQIMTAPVVVASWISLQYYGSTVAPQVFGGGNKLLHNVAGGIGVVEGNGGVLRAGLPWQSVHDGARFVHEPLRLTVCIEAPREAITAVLSRHASVRALCDNSWLHLFALDDAGRMAWRYDGGLQWRPAALGAEEARVRA